MTTINDTALNDNQLIFVLRITLDSETLRYATREITLSSNTYSDSVLLRIDFSTLQSISKNISIYNGGGVGSLSSMEFSLSNYSGKYIENFYPTTSQDYLTARKVEVGFLWVGATTEAEITWQPGSFYINSVFIEPNKITCFCIELSDIEIMELPYYEVQKEFDNEMSYFTDAPSENVGNPIPILYGDLYTADLLGSGRAFLTIVRYAPTICIDSPRLKFIICSHNVSQDSYNFEETRYELVKYIPGVESYITCWNDTYAGTCVKNDFQYSIELQGTVGKILGSMWIRLKEVDRYHTAGDVDNIIDESETRGMTSTSTYETVGDAETVSLRISGSASEYETGSLSQKCYIRYKYSSDAAASRDVMFRVRNEMIDVPGLVVSDTDTPTDTTVSTKFLQFGNSVQHKKDGTLPWTIDEVCGLTYLMDNLDATPDDNIRIYDMAVFLDDIKVRYLVGKRYLSFPRITPEIQGVTFTTFTMPNLNGNG